MLVVTNSEQADAVRKELPRIRPEMVLSEPVDGIPLRQSASPPSTWLTPMATRFMAVLPADHFIAQAAKYRRYCTGCP